MKNTKLKKNKEIFEFGPGVTFGTKKTPMSLKKKIALIGFITVCTLILIFGTVLAVGYSMMSTNVIADGVYIDNIHLGGLTLDAAEERIDNLSLRDSYNIVLVQNETPYYLNIEDMKYTIDAKATAQKAFSYGKGGNTFSKILDAFKAKASRLDLLPVFVFDEAQLNQKLNELGFNILGTMTEHKIEVIGEQITITPGTSGYTNDPSNVYTAINRALRTQCENEIEVNFNLQHPAQITLDKLSEYVSETPTDPTFTVKDGEVQITEGRAGYSFDKAAAAQTLSQVAVGGTPVTIACHMVAPSQPLADVQAKLFSDELASYPTHYNAGNVGRSTNIAVAAGKLNGKILLPGEEFSFNDTVGKRTTANGFKPAAEYQNGQSVTGIGGGTCQVSTTVYSAALYANLEIVSRRNHSMSVSYVPLGQDATVTDSGTDLKFKNNTKYPIKLVTSAGGGTVTVKILGTQPDPPINVKIVNNRTSALSATTTRIVYDKATGAELSREKISTSKYKPH